MLYENENDVNGIIQILKKFHKFVPCDKKQNQNREVTEDENVRMLTKSRCLESKELLETS